jgi:adenosylcobyric acid synthase
VLGVVPHVPALRIADEDSVGLESRSERARGGAGQVDLAVVKLPQISNYDDVLALEHEAGVSVRFVQTPAELRGADLVVLPGTKSTAADLTWLRATGLAAELGRRGAGGGFILGICGGCQMLGEWILDPERVESSQECVPGLGLLGLCTRFEPGKLTAQVEARVHAPGFFGADHSELLQGYEIHMGQLSRSATARGAFRLSSRNGRGVDVIDGAISATGNVVGTMLHGLLENESLRASLLAALRRERGSETAPAPAIPSREAEYDRLEAVVRQSLDLPLLRRLAQQPHAGG